MKSTVTIFFLLVILYCAIMYIVFTVPVHGTRIYNCSIAEISPDYPLDVKKQCREQNAKKINGTGNTGQDRNDK